jgi:chitinase
VRRLGGAREHAANRTAEPSDIAVKDITTILYSFADVKTDGTIGLTDSYADEQKHYPGDSWNDQGNNVYGCIKQVSRPRIVPACGTR